MNRRPFSEYFTGPYVRFLNIFARNLFPLFFRIKFHRLRGVNIGNNTFIGKQVNFDNKNPRLIEIGSNVGIAMGVTILVHRRDVQNYDSEKGYNDYPFVFDSVKIKDNCQIGTNAIILPGVTIGRSSIIGAGAVVTKDIPEKSFAVGVPAKVIKTFEK